MPASQKTVKSFSALTVTSGSAPFTSLTLSDITLAPGSFRQINEVLVSNGLSLSNGYVRVERVRGKAPYYAYGVINDQVNADGSFVPPMVATGGLRPPRVALDHSRHGRDSRLCKRAGPNQYVRIAAETRLCFCCRGNPVAGSPRQFLH